MPMRTHKVLIVDDEFAIRDMLRMALEIAEYECLEADTISEAHRLIVDERPDIVLLDWMLPGGSGIELLRRIKRSEATRAGSEESSVLKVEGLTLDQESRRIFLDGKPIEMGPTEFNLLQFFMSHPERAYTRGQLLDHVWGANVYVEERTVDVHIRRLRKALQTPDADYSELVQTVRGTGYRFSATVF